MRFFSCCLLLGAISQLAAMAGGGGGFGGGGGGGGFSGGGGGGFSFNGGGSYSGSGELNWVVALIVVVIAIAAWLIEEQRKKVQRRRYSHFRRREQSRKHEQLVQRMQQLDAHFNWSQTEERLRKAFTAIQAAWCKQDMEPVLQFVSDGIQERFSLQLAEQRELGLKDTMPSLLVQDLTIAEVREDGAFLVCTVSIRGQVTCYKEKQDGTFHSGLREQQSFHEYWSLIRRKGVVSKDKQEGLMEGRCPNCGDRIPRGQQVRCPSCQALLRGGDHDWVLAEITQACDWQSLAQPPHHVEELRHDDSGFTVQHIEDRVSVCLYRWLLAKQGKNTLPAIATKRYATTYDGDDEPGFIGEAAVGSVDVFGVWRDDGYDHVLVAVHWNGRRMTRSQDGRLQFGRRVAPRRHYFHLIRAIGGKSHPQQVVSSAHCQQCGAPHTDLEATECNYCGSVFTDQHQWLLDGVYAWSSSRVATLKTRIRRSFVDQPLVTGPTSIAPTLSIRHEADILPNGRELATWIFACIHADGRVEQRERRVLDQLVAKLGLPAVVIQDLMLMPAEGFRDVPAPSSSKEALAWLNVLAEIAMADDLLDKAESKLLNHLAQQGSLSKADVRLALAKGRRQAVQASRARRKVSDHSSS